MRYLVWIWLGGCAYQPGSLRSPSAPTTVVGCLDVVVTRGPSVRADGPVLAYQFGNRCDREARVDVGGVAVVARAGDGREQVLVAFDPRSEIHVAGLPARTSAAELVEYGGATPVAADAQLCADLGGLDADAARAPRWVCLGGAP